MVSNSLLSIGTGNEKTAGLTCGFSDECSVLAPTYSPLASTIGASGLNFRVRNGIGCGPKDESPDRNFGSRYRINISACAKNFAQEISIRVQKV